MKISVPVGTYIIAVSGGVDSMVLLDTLKDNPKLRLIVAHFDHGIREDSKKDRDLVATAAKEYGLKYEEECGLLGSLASEEKAREARYNFLKKVKNKYKADSIITAHHQDDLIETLLLNVFFIGRIGTMSPKLRSDDGKNIVIRPLIYVSENDIRQYSNEQNFPVVCCQCPLMCGETVHGDYKRRRVKQLISQLEKEIPEIKHSLLASLKNVHTTHLLDKELWKFE